MKKATLDCIVEKLQRDLREIKHELYENKRKIKTLANRQRVLKESRHELHHMVNKLTYKK